MAITDWPLDERPREKLLARGAHSLSDAELLAIFLRTGIPGKTAVDLARELLTEYGGLRPLLKADKSRFCQSPGLGQAKYALLQATLEMGRRHLQEKLNKGDALTNPHSAITFLTSKLRDYSHEVFACLFLDNRHRIISFGEISHGTINGASVHPRSVVNRALAENAAAVILAHNHPSGIAEPSQADRHLTQRLVDALTLMDIRILDHIIIGDGEHYSFAEKGLL